MSHRNLVLWNLAKSTAFMVVVVGLGASASASCGDSLSMMAAQAAAVQSQIRPVQQNSESGRNVGNDSSIVGLWHILFTVGGQPNQEAYQLWNAGGTEVHNPNLSPGGGVCLGVWRHTPQGTFKLTHRVWLYDPSGNFLGIGHLSETVSVSDGGKTQSGSFTLAIFDPSGNFLSEVTGSVTGERIPAE
jgi:hypothetical protein